MTLGDLAKDPAVYFIALCMGFVAFKVYDFLNLYGESRSVADSALEILGYGVLNIVIATFYAGNVIAQLTIPVPRNDLLLIIFALIVQPSLFAAFFAGMQTFFRARKSYFVPTRTTAWEWIFCRAGDFVKKAKGDRTYVVVATFADGKTLAGTFERDAYASDTRGEAQLYLTRHVRIGQNGDFERAASTESEGIIVNCSDAIAVEIYPETATKIFR